MKYKVVVTDELGFRWEQILTSREEILEEVSGWLLTSEFTPIDSINIDVMDD